MLRRTILLLTLSCLLMSGTVACMFPLGGRTIVNHGPTEPGSIRVEHVKSGALLLFSIIPVDSHMDVGAEISLMYKRFNCKDLKNIDVLFYNRSFYIVGFERAVIRADCIRN